MNVAILYDVDGWAYHAEAKSMDKYMRRYGIKCDLYRYPVFYQQISQKQRDHYDGVYLYPRQANPLTFPAEKTIVKFSSYGDFSKQHELNSASFKNIICTNREILRLAARDIGHLNSKIIYMPLCVDSEVFYPKDNIKSGTKLTIGFAGNSKREGKCFDIISEAAQELSNLVNFKAVTFHSNRLSHEQMPEFYRELDLLITMSKSEGGPLTAFEAGMCGIPTISGCSSSAINEVTIDNYNAFHIDGTKQALVEKVKELNDNRELIARAKENIIDTMFYGHSWTSQARAYARLLESFKD